MNFQQTDTLSNPAQDTASAFGPPPELTPLYEPDPVAFTFETIGWKVVAGLLLIGLMVLAYVLTRNYIRNRYRREALAELERMEGGPGEVPRIFAVLKRTAIQAFGREKVADLHGREWLRFLEQTGKQVRLLDYESQILGATYGSGETASQTMVEILSNAKKWVKTHAAG